MAGNEGSLKQGSPNVEQKQHIQLRKAVMSLTELQRTINSAEDFENFKILIQHQRGFIISKIIFTACELGVFDLLMESGELLTSKMIAEHLGTNSNGMERLLDACVALNLLRIERKDDKALYGNTNISSLYLTKSSPKSQVPYVMWYSENTYRNIYNLADAVREGKNLNKKSFGSTSANFFDAVYRSEEKLKIFLGAMNSTWSLFGREVMAAFDLSPFPLICDLGGGSGALAKDCISLYPNSTVTILDLPEAVKTAQKHFVSAEESRITFHEADFFKDPFPEADLYLMARILHDWDDDKCVQLLSKVHKACKPGAGVLVVELVLSEDKSGPLDVHIESIVMLLHTEGKERTFSEYSALFSAAGFKEIQIKKTSHYYVMLGRK